MSSDPIYSAEKIAGLFGVSTNTVREWITQGCPATKVGRSWSLIPADVHEWRVKRERERTITEMGMVDESQARRRKMAAEALIAETQAAQVTGQAMSIADWQASEAALIGTARAKFLGLGVKLGPEVALSDDPVECQDLIDAAVREVLSELSEFELPDDTGSPSEPEESSAHGVPAVGTAAGSNGKRVGRRGAKA